MVTENRVENNADDQKIRRFLFSMRLSMNFGLNKRCTFTEPLNRIHMTHCSIHPNELIFLFRRETYTPNERYSFIFAVYILWEQNLQKKMNLSSKGKKSYFFLKEHSHLMRYILCICPLLSIWIHMSKNWNYKNAHN